MRYIILSPMNNLRMGLSKMRRFAIDNQVLKNFKRFIHFIRLSVFTNLSSLLFAFIDSACNLKAYPPK